MGTTEKARYTLDSKRMAAPQHSLNIINMNDGRTKKVIARSRHLILMHKSKWNEQQRSRAKELFKMFPRLELA